MNDPQPRTLLPALGEAFAGGFYAGCFQLGDGTRYALVVAPTAEGEHADSIWIEDDQEVPGAHSYCDGLANTQAMMEAGSALAQWARELRIAGFDDWYLPSQDELELCYRNLKPTPRENYCWARSGINLSALPPTRSYTPDAPVQTCAPAFQAAGAEAFEPDWYWSSTHYAADSDYAWSQYFGHGTQFYCYTTSQLRARAVRRVAL